MSYWYTEFDGLTLPTQEPEHEIGTDEARWEAVEYPGGVFDPLGSEQARPGERKYTAEYLLTAASASALRTAYNAVRAKWGKRGILERTWDSGTVEWTTARLVEVRAKRKIGDVNTLPIRLEFVQVDACWYGATEQTDSEFLTSSPANFTLANGGNARVANLVVAIRPGASAAMTAFTLTMGSGALTYSGTIPAGSELVIDCGARSVLLDGAEAYDGFALGAGHAQEEWLVLAPGNNTLTVTRTGGDATSIIEWSFYDGWH